MSIYSDHLFVLNEIGDTSRGKRALHAVGVRNDMTQTLMGAFKSQDKKAAMKTIKIGKMLDKRLEGTNYGDSYRFMGNYLKGSAASEPPKVFPYRNRFGEIPEYLKSKQK